MTSGSDAAYRGGRHDDNGSNDEGSMMFNRIREWLLRRHLSRSHGYSIQRGDRDSDGHPLDSWMATAPLSALRSQHDDDHGTYKGGGGNRKHHHAL